MHYLLDNPSALPWQQTYPLTTNVTLLLTEIAPGSSLLPSAPRRASLTVPRISPCAGLRIEDFIERLVMSKQDCKAAVTRQDNALSYVFGGRAARTIAAATGGTILRVDGRCIESAVNQ